MKRPAELSGSADRTNQEVTKQLDTSLVSASPQAFARELEAEAERFMKKLEAHAFRFYVGQPGCLVLDLFERLKKFGEAYREKARQYLDEHPGAIPHWRVETQDRRSLSRDAFKVFEALQRVWPELTLERFLSACTPSVGGLNSLLEGLGADEVYRLLESALSAEELMSHETLKRLVRDKEGQP
jgi:hypothetical protein